MVVWIIGLSGAGKTTLANEVAANIRQSNNDVVLVDGDVIREMFGNDLGYSIEDRKKNAGRICQLCKFLDDQNINVVCAILSIFPESRVWNRKNFKGYYEVYIDAPVENLIERDSKGIYAKYLKGEIREVAGMDLEFPAPSHADLTIYNAHSKEALLLHAKPIAEKILATRK